MSEQGPLISAVEELDESAMADMKRHLDELTKPRGSLGRLETIAQHVAGVQGRIQVSLARKLVLVFAADHGIARAGVSAYPQEVTHQMANNLLQGGAAINSLAASCAARVVVADVGVCGRLSPHPRLLVRKLAAGTRDFSQEPAMPLAHAGKVVALGGELFAACTQQHDVDLVCLGELGIGNTSAASAIIAAVTRADVSECTGRGTGIDSRGWQQKVKLIRRALQLHRLDGASPLDILAGVGGYEIGAMIGAMIAAASQRKLVILDGVVCAAAALLAVQLCPPVHGYLLASHLSVERGHRIALEYLHLQPLLDLQMRLGEGTGAVLAAFIADAACRCTQGMATFGQAGVADRSEGNA